MKVRVFKLSDYIFCACSLIYLLQFFNIIWNEPIYVFITFLAMNVSLMISTFMQPLFLKYKNTDASLNILRKNLLYDSLAKFAMLLYLTLLLPRIPEASFALFLAIWAAIMVASIIVKSRAYEELRKIDVSSLAELVDSVEAPNETKDEMHGIRWKMFFTLMAILFFDSESTVVNFLIIVLIIATEYYFVMKLSGVFKKNKIETKGLLMQVVLFYTLAMISIFVALFDNSFLVYVILGFTTIPLANFINRIE